MKLGTPPRFDEVNSWAPAGAPEKPGEYSLGHATACAYDALIAAPNLTLLDYPFLAQPQGPTLADTLAIALQAYSNLLFDWLFDKFPANLVNNFVRRGLGNYTALVVNNSWVFPINRRTPFLKAAPVDTSIILVTPSN